MFQPVAVLAEVGGDLAEIGRGQARRLHMGEQVLGQLLEPLGDPVDAATVEVHLSNLRRKIGAELIRTVRGVGYLLQP